jgi:hypothetical protein
LDPSSFGNFHIFIRPNFLRKITGAMWGQTYILLAEAPGDPQRRESRTNVHA